MIRLTVNRYATTLGMALTLVLGLPAVAQTPAPSSTPASAPAPIAASAQAPVPASTATPGAAPSEAQNQTNSPTTDTTTVTIFGRKRTPGDVTRTQIETNTASSCGFMNTDDHANDEIVQDYLQSFGQADNGSNQAPTPDSSGTLQNVDQSDPNVAGNHFKDTTPFGDASQDNAANANTLPGMQVGQGGVPVGPTGACGPSDKAFAAGRNYIARKDHSLKDAFAAFDAQDYAKALPLFKTSFDKMGYDQAALMVGKMYVAGMGTPQDTAQGVVWLKRVAEAKFGPGDAQTFDPADPNHMSTRSDAAMLLGKIYLTGWGTARDPKAAKMWYAKADEFGYIPGTHIVGQIYQNGYGGEKSIVKAVGYFKKAATVGYTPSQYELGVIYYNGDDGVPQDKALAAQWLVQAAKGGHREALFAVGRMYDLGDTLPADPQKAIVYYKEAALKGQPDAEDAMGLYFYTGQIVAKDDATARQWFNEAAKRGDPDAMFNLGVMLVNGEGGQKDMAVAYVWFTLASRLGLDKADAAAKEIAPRMTADERARADSVLNPKPAAKP